MGLVICQISRGLSPAVSISEACHAARVLGVGYSLVHGMPAVQAKNAAVSIADSNGLDLLMVEDDVLAEMDVWRKAEWADEVAFAPCVTKEGAPNTRRKPNGSVWYSGTPFLKVSRWVLDRLPRPLFQAMDYRPIKATCELVRLRENTEGKHSDVDFWAKLQSLRPVPCIVELPPITHLTHPLSVDHNTPSDITES